MNRCPQCGEPVSQFAAGCAICGADLSAARRRRRRPAGPSLPRLGVPAGGADVALVVCVVALAWLAPVLAVVVAGFGALDRHRRGRHAMRNVLLVLAAVAVGLAISPRA